MTLVKLFSRLVQRGTKHGTPVLSLQREEEEAEIAKAQQEAQRENNRFAESLLEKAAHRSYPFLKDRSSKRWTFTGPTVSDT